MRIKICRFNSKKYTLNKFDKVLEISAVDKISECVFRDARILAVANQIDRIGKHECVHMRARVCSCSCICTKIGWKSLWWTQSIKRQLTGSSFAFSVLWIWQNRKYFHSYANLKIAMFACYLVFKAKVFRLRLNSPRVCVWQ